MASPDNTEANDLFDEASLAHLDALTYGREYVTVGSADEDGAPPIITFESPLDMTLMWDARLRMPLYGLRECEDRFDFGLAPDDRLVTLYMPMQTIHAVGLSSAFGCNTSGSRSNLSTCVKYTGNTCASAGCPIQELDHYELKIKPLIEAGW